MNNKEFKIVTIVQARMGSSRLHGKVMLKSAGKPMLLHIIERISATKYRGEIVIATSSLKEDDIIADLCIQNNINYFRGSHYNLLERHFNAAVYYEADAVVKIPSDCPLIDPDVIDKVIFAYIQFKNQFDYISNLHPPTFPDGNDVEIFSFNSLYKAYKLAYKHYEIEHTTPYIWTRPSVFKIANIAMPDGLDYSNKYRFVLDYYEDYKLINEIFENLYRKNRIFKMNDILNFVNQNPDLLKINRHLIGNSWYSKLASEFNADYYKYNSLYSSVNINDNYNFIDS
jgi:spore coat polysaccharide biosynthesis protein SpsF